MKNQLIAVALRFFGAGYIFVFDVMGCKENKVCLVLSKLSTLFLSLNHKDDTISRLQCIVEFTWPVEGVYALLWIMERP